MPHRTTPLVQDQIYHIFNRGVAKQPIFFSTKDYERFLELVDYYRFTNTPCSYSQFKKVAFEDRQKILSDLSMYNDVNVEIQIFCLMNNHFHFLLKQITDKGIQTFMTNIQNSYAKYFNIRTERSGPLFQSAFKVVRIESEEQLLHVSRYIHLNPTTSYLVTPEDLFSYPWSSISHYISTDSKTYPFVTTKQVLSLIKSNNYKQFILDQAAYQRELSNIKHLLLE